MDAGTNGDNPQQTAPSPEGLTRAEFDRLPSFKQLGTQRRRELAMEEEASPEAARAAQVGARRVRAERPSQIRFLAFALGVAIGLMLAGGGSYLFHKTKAPLSAVERAAIDGISTKQIEGSGSSAEVSRRSAVEIEPTTVDSGAGSDDTDANTVRAVTGLSQDASAPALPRTPVNRPDDPLISRLREQGETAMVSGDIAAARLYFRSAAEKGDAGAMLRLGDSYDPAFLARTGVRGMRGDAAEAQSWYERARKTESSAVPDGQ